MYAFGELVRQSDKSVTELLESYLVGQESSDSVNVTEKTVGIATSIEIKCEHKHNILTKTLCQETTLHNHQNNKPVSRFLSNVMFVLALQSFGASGTEAERIIYFLGLPHLHLHN